MSIRLYKKEKLMAAIGLLLCLFSYGWFRLAISLGERAGFMRKIGLMLGGAMCRFWSLMPIPVSELVWIFGVMAAIIITVLLTVRRGIWGFLGAVCRLILAAGIIYLLFSFVYLVQYSSPSLADMLSMKVEKYSTAQLAQAADTVAKKLNTYAEKVNRDANGLYAPKSYKELAQSVLESYRMGSMSSLFSRGPEIAPKQGIFLSKVMSYLNLAGYFFPITGESVVSSDLIETSVSFTTAHEEAHSFGIGPEKEANFAAFLCCVESENDELIYSGLFNGYIYLNNALYRSDKALWEQVYSTLSDSVRADLTAKNEHLKKYEGAVNDFGSSVNDSFIKSTGQQEGIQSYGLVADMIIAYYLGN
ncbi:MAG: DUF3810 domain-containing protein [Clostridiaceae bacterium]|nr:DUF3810 domain-containing protein [Clostridiaceae bacterium]